MNSRFATLPVEQPPSCGAAASSAAETGNITPLLHEIRHALADWLDHGSEHSIDLRSLPMAPGEEDRLLDQLGHGEVQAQISGLGRSELIETRYPGVWLVSHYGDDEQIIGRSIEISDCPWLLKTQPADAAQALHELDQATELQQDPTPSPPPAASGEPTQLENGA